jgi:hypothetical protein
MALYASMTQQVPAQTNPTPGHATDASALMGMLLLSVYAANKSKKELRKLKRKFIWDSFRLKMKSMFKAKAVSDRTLIYILLGVALIALLFIEPVAALVVVLVALILILAGVI